MELSQSLTLNEEALTQLPAAKRPVFVFEWLRYLDKILLVTQKSDIKECQKKLVDQLLNHMQDCPGPPTRKLIARCLATLFSVGDTFLLFEAVDKCNEILKNKDDSPSYLQVKMTAICCLGSMYEKLGRMMGRSYEDTVNILLRVLKSADSQTRIEIMLTLEKVCTGMGAAISGLHREIYKAVRICLIDRAMVVRGAAAKCLLELLNHAPFLYTLELEALATLCFRALEGANYEARCALAKLLGCLVAWTQRPQATANIQNKNMKQITVEDALNVLLTGFMRSGVGFLKGTGEIIKGSSGVNREVRVGVTYAYVVFVQELGIQWLEQNLKLFLTHVLNLASNPRSASTHVDVVYSRKCINYILRSTLGKMLGEKAQVSACKEIAAIILKEIGTLDVSGEVSKETNQDVFYNQHLLVCALQEIGSLVVQLGTTARDLVVDQNSNLIDVTMRVCVHPCYATRLAAALCLRCMCIAVPSQTTPLIDKCVGAIEDLRTSPEAISGHSVALAAIISSVRLSPLGIPHSKAKVIFNTAEELLRSASQSSRLSVYRTQAGWLLIGSIMALGVPAVRGLLPRMLLLWRNSFPRSAKDLESEKARGDSFTWQVSLEGRAGSLAAIHSLMSNCPELVSDEVLRRLLVPIESALAMLININTVLKSYGQQVKAPAAMVRLRLYESLLAMKPTAYETSFTHLLRLLVTEFTLTENPANTTTSLLRTVCHADDSVILGTWLQETDHKTIEDQLQPNSAAGSGALEHDPCALFMATSPTETPGPLPLGVAVIDASVLLFGQIFPRVTNKHRLQMIEHFADCLRHAKSQRQEAIQTNVFTALLCGLRAMSEMKATLGPAEVRTATTSLLMGAITSSNPILRCAAGESIGRLAQVVADFKFTAELAQTSFDKLKSARDAVSRTGYSLALGCLHRYVGGLGSSQHLSTSVSILLALAQDCNSTVVQIWALHALALISDSGGPMFRGFVEPTLSLTLKLLLSVPQSYVEVHQCIGKVLSALITTIGPELQGNTPSICMTRSSFSSACAIMQDQSDPLVQAEATGCLQQLHLFAPKHVNLYSLVPTLCCTLSSDHLLLRKAAVSCLRQLTQREAKEVCEHALNFATNAAAAGDDTASCIHESGLPATLFNMLNTETDSKLIKDIHDTLICMLQVLAAENLTHWLGLCKDILTITTEFDETSSAAAGSSEGTDVDPETDDDRAEFHASESVVREAVQPRWPTRVFAAECVRKIIATCEKHPEPHFDIVKAKELASEKKGDYLVLHVSDLVRMAFVAATSDSDQLRLDGLYTMKIIIEKFAHVPEPEFPGHLLLEQFQAQVGAALRPAFSSDTSSLVTAAACDVCSAWISSNVARNLNDLRRVHQLLVQSLVKLKTKTNASTQLYNESLATLEKLVILKAWAQVYAVAMKMNSSAPAAELLDESNRSDDSQFQVKEYKGDSLLQLVQPELPSLSQYWLAALKDYALLSLPPEFSSQLPHDGGAFYTTDTMDSAKPHYSSTWSSILYAAALWLNAEDRSQDDETAQTRKEEGDLSTKRFFLIYGICIENLCSTRLSEDREATVNCLKSLYTLLQSSWAKKILVSDDALPIELANVLHRTVLTKDDGPTQILCIGVLNQVLQAGQGRDETELVAGKSLAFAGTEVCLCACARHFPSLCPEESASRVLLVRVSQSFGISISVVAGAISCLELLLGVCSKTGTLSIHATILYIVTGVLKELATKNNNSSWNNAATQATLRCLQAVVKERDFANANDRQRWISMLQSTLSKIINITKTAGWENSKVDEITVLMAVGVFILKAPSCVVSAPNLQYPCINYFKQCLQSSNLMVKFKSVQTLHSIFTLCDNSIAIPYIHALTPSLLKILFKPNRSVDELEVKIFSEAVASIDSLIAMVESKNRIQLLSLLLPALTNSLLENLPSAGVSRDQHEASIKWLMKIGFNYPQEFKTILNNCAELRRKVENVVKSSQERDKTADSTANLTRAVVPPSIKLKTDFSNFS